MANCIYILPKIYRPEKQLVKINQIYRKDADCSENYILVPEFFCATFNFWDIVDFDVYDLLYVKDLRDFCEPDSDANQWG